MANKANEKTRLYNDLERMRIYIKSMRFILPRNRRRRDELVAEILSMQNTLNNSAL